jgi:hypothetical protein
MVRRGNSQSKPKTIRERKSKVSGPPAPVALPWQVKGPMPDFVKSAQDRLEPALWLGRRIARFRVLTEHPMFPAIFGRLVSGQAPAMIIRWLWTKIPPDDVFGPQSTTAAALERRLLRFRSVLPPDVVIAANTIDAQFKRAGAVLDVLEEFDILIRFQKARLEKGAQREATLPLPIESLRREVGTLADLLTARHNAEQGYGGVQIGDTYIGGQHVTVQGSGSPVDVVRQFMQREPNKAPGVLELMDRIDELDAPAAQ